MLFEEIKMDLFFIWSIVTISIIVKIVTIFIIVKTVKIATTNSVSSHLRHQVQSNILLSETFTLKFHFVSWILIYLLYDSFKYSESNVNPNDIRYQDLVFSIKIQDSWHCSLPKTPHSLDHKNYSTTVTNGNQHNLYEKSDNGLLSTMLSSNSISADFAPHFPLATRFV